MVIDSKGLGFAWMYGAGTSKVGDLLDKGLLSPLKIHKMDSSKYKLPELKWDKLVEEDKKPMEFMIGKGKPSSLWTTTESIPVEKFSKPQDDLFNTAMSSMFEDLLSNTDWGAYMDVSPLTGLEYSNTIGTDSNIKPKFIGLDYAGVEEKIVNYYDGNTSSKTGKSIEIIDGVYMQYIFPEHQVVFYKKGLLLLKLPKEHFEIGDQIKRSAYFITSLLIKYLNVSIKDRSKVYDNVWYGLSIL